MKYCDSIYQTKRWKTRVVKVGHIGIGGNNPIRIQSMTTSSTRDVAATVAQIIRLSDAGCELARVTVQGMKEAEACEEIKNALIQKNYTIPLIADIHFYPPAAMKVADSVDKVRINPGNFVDKRAQFKKIEYNEITYQTELQKIEEKFAPLVLKCKQLKRAIRIGTNHGSLSDRIMNYYGDTPKGMVESAIEFTNVARKYDFHDLIFSMKASNPLVMIEAYRLLVAKMKELGWNYPLHLGVTEAGEGEDGRVKSAIGIGSLLLDGLGDTIRVSLTEDPWREIDPCQRIVKCTKNYQNIASSEERVESLSFKRKKQIALHRDGTVILSVWNKDIEEETFYQALGVKMQLGRPFRDQNSCDALLLEESPSEKARQKLLLLEEGGIKIIATKTIVTEEESSWTKSSDMIFFSPKEDKIHAARKYFSYLHAQKREEPVILSFDYDCSEDDFVIKASMENGLLLCDGLGDGICLRGKYSVDFKKRVSFSLLQGCRLRNFKTEFISCPGCGRTLFELQKVAAKIREKTGHLPGVKIAIMGCIVNGPGEMADADFGYVGSKPGKIDLYVGKECVERDIEMEGAEERLVALIKAHGRWVEKEERSGI